MVISKKISGKKTGLARLIALCRYSNYRLAPLFLLALLTASCGGGGGGGNSGPSDTTRPGVQIQDAPDSHDGRTAFTLGIRFSESVSGFVRGDINVSGATVTAFSGSGASYTATLTPSTPPGNIALEVPANVARDAAGNGNTAATRQTVAYVAPDTTPPAVNINAPASHNGQPFEVSFVFSEPVRGFEAGDIRITGARIAPFPSQTSSTRYTATLTPSTPLGNIALEVPANVARDLAGNGNTAAAPQTVAYVPPDITPPRVSINAPVRHNGRPFAVSFVFSEAVRGFEAADIRISGGRITAFSSQASSARYTATLTPSTPLGTIALEVPANVAQDAAGNGNTAAARQTVAYVPPDITPPRVSINAPVRHNGRPFAVSFVFSEAVRGFEAADVRISGGRITAFSFQASARYTATLTPSTPLGNIALEVPANVARDLAGNGNIATAPRRIEYVAPPTAEKVRISGRLSFDRPAFIPLIGGLDYSNTRQEPIRGVWVEAVNASGAVLARTRSDAEGRYRLDVDANTEVRIRIRAHMQRSAAGGPRWDVKVTDNTNGNALYVAQGDLASSGTGASTRNLNAASGWVGGARGRYANARVAGPFAILSSTYEALQRFAGVDPDINLPALEYRWSVRNRSAAGNLADGAIDGSFYSPTERLIYLVGQENEDTDEYDHSVVFHEFAHHFTSVMSRDDSLGGNWTDEARLDMRLAFSEGFGDALGAIITDDPLYRDTFGPFQALAGTRNMEANPVNPAADANRIGWYHSLSVTAMLYDLYDTTNDGADRLSLGLTPIYNTLTSNGFRRNRYYTSIYTFANQLPEHVPNRTATQSGLDALLRRYNIFGRGANGAGETNRGGLPATARVLPVYKSITSGDSPITLCSVDDNGTFNRLGNRALVEVTFAESGSHTLTMTSASGSTGTLPRFRLRPYRNAAMRTRRQLIDEPRSQTVTGNFRAGEAAVLEAYDERNVDDDDSNDGDSCFTFSVVKNR